MPLQRCLREGKAGWRWGREGYCFTGDNAKNKALSQAVAILRSQARDRGLAGDEIDRYVKDKLEIE